MENSSMKNNLLFTLSRSISLLGTQIYNFVLALLVLKLSNSAIPFAITLLISMIPRIILGPIAGILVDRFNRKAILILTDTLSGVISLILYFSLALKGININFIYFLSFILNSVNTIFDVCIISSINNIFSEKDLLKISSINENISSLSNIMAPIIGGIVFGLIDFKLFVFINTISFIISALLECKLEFKHKNNLQKSNKNIRLEFIDSIKFIKNERVVLLLYSAAILINIFFSIGIYIPIPYIANIIFKFKPYEYGIMEAMLPIGMILSSTILFLFKEPKKKYKYVTIALLTESISILLMSFPLIINSNNLIYLCIYTILLLILGIAISVVNIYIRVIMQKIIPDDMKGKVFGTLSTFCMIATPFSTIFSAIYIEKINAFFLPLVSGVLFLILTIFMAKNKYIKNI